MLLEFFSWLFLFKNSSKNGEKSMPGSAQNGQELSRSETITALAHYYRAEAQRSLAWRERLDRTTNWAVGTTAAFLGFGFSHPEIPHSHFIFGFAIVYILLIVESRRYRFYDAYEYRVRLVHQNFVCNILKGRMDQGPDAPWRLDLAKDLLHPHYKMKLLQAMGKRIYANYMYLFGVLMAGWMLKIKLHPLPAHSWRQFLDQAAVGGIPGWVTFLFIFLFVAHLLAFIYLGRKAKGGRNTLYRGSEKGL
jgi:uncharacterized membrane protein